MHCASLQSTHGFQSFCRALTRTRPSMYELFFFRIVFCLLESYFVPYTCCSGLTGITQAWVSPSMGVTILSTWNTQQHTILETPWNKKMEMTVDAVRFISSFSQGLWFCYVVLRHQKIVETQALFACEAKVISLNLTLVTGFQLPSLFVTPP